MGGDDLGAAFHGDLFQKLPSGTTPFFLASADGRSASADTRKSAAKGVADDERGSPAGGASGAMIEGGDGDFSTRPYGEFRRCCKEDHRIKPAAYGEHRAFAFSKRCLDSILHFGCYNGDRCHDSFNLPVHGGVPLGDARSAGNAVGIPWPDRVLPRTDLAEYAARHLPDTPA